MSGTSPKKKKSPPISGLKPGPLKATLPVASLMRVSSGITKCKSNSPTTSLQKRFSPDGSLSGQRSPSSFSFRGLTRSRGPCSNIGSPNSGCIRRTASLDAIYNKGQWSSDAFHIHLGILQVDKSTQTEEGWSDRKSRQSESSNCDDLKLEKYLRNRLRAGRAQGLGLRLISPPMIGDHSVTPPNLTTPPSSSRDGVQSPMQGFALAMPTRPTFGRPPIRSSLEGLNQEIERLVLKDIDDRTITFGSIPEGHRAPLADLLRHTRSVNTQTPGGHDEIDTDFGSSGPPSRGSLSPLYQLELLHGNLNESCGSSPDEIARLGTSPHINRFLAREPPDGCEKVSLRHEEVRRSTGEDLTSLKPITTGHFKPSLGSAFQPLQTPVLLNGECPLVEPSGSGSPTFGD